MEGKRPAARSDKQGRNLWKDHGLSWHSHCLTNIAVSRYCCSALLLAYVQCLDIAVRCSKISSLYLLYISYSGVLALFFFYPKIRHCCHLSLNLSLHSLLNLFLTCLSVVAVLCWLLQLLRQKMSSMLAHTQWTMHFVGTIMISRDCCVCARSEDLLCRDR